MAKYGPLIAFRPDLIVYYRPNDCGRPSPFNGRDPEEVNIALYRAERVLSLTDLTLNETRVIMTLFTYDGATMKDIAVITGMSQSMVSKTVNGLLNRGMVTKKATLSDSQGRPSDIFYLSIDRQRITNLVRAVLDDIESMLAILK